MAAVHLLLTFIASFSAANGLFSDILSNSLSAITGEVEDSSDDIVGDSNGLIPGLVKSWGSLVKCPNLLANLSETGALDDIEEEFSIGLSTGNAELGIERLSRKYGYPLINYTVVTEDGYKLKMYRIRRNGPPVFVMHGLLSSSDDFMTAGPKSALAYLLADSGFDVWLGNARGNKHSRHNVLVSPSNPKFWDFSWHEIGIYDLPVMIDYVLKKTGRKKLPYIGHSQGTTSFYVMASEKPEYNKKISIMISLAPSAYATHMVSPLLRLLSRPGNTLFPVTKLIGVNEFDPENVLVEVLKSLLCGETTQAHILCSNVLFLIAGFDYYQLNVTNLPVIYGHVPSGAAIKQLIHYSQCIISKDFRQFDCGARENRRRYGAARPSKYKLENIVAPVSLIYSDTDWLSSSVDVARLRRELPNVVDYHKVPYKGWNHLDYLWAKDFKKTLYGHIKKLLNYYN